MIRTEQHHKILLVIICTIMATVDYSDRHQPLNRHATVSVTGWLSPAKSSVKWGRTVIYVQPHNDFTTSLGPAISCWARLGRTRPPRHALRATSRLMTQSIGLRHLVRFLSNNFTDFRAVVNAVNDPTTVVTDRASRPR